MTTCSCSGIRSCLLCEQQGRSVNKQKNLDLNDTSKVRRFVYCNRCDKCWHKLSFSKHLAADAKCEDVAAAVQCESNKYIHVKGVMVLNEFLTWQEEEQINQRLNMSAWIVSQSGRRKQDYGPQINFKKRKLKFANFFGLPGYSKAIVDKMRSHDKCRQLLVNFDPVELCNLEYVADRGSAIDPHFDDCWIWGEKLVTVNMLSDTILTLSKDDMEVEIAMPRRSLTVIFSDARYLWKHEIKREHINGRRTCMTFRELANEFLPGGQNSDIGRRLTDLALSFEGNEHFINIKA